MRRDLRYSVWAFMLVLSMVLVASGCSAFLGDREQGFTLMQRGFSTIESTPGLRQVVELKQIKVVIVGDREQFQWRQAAQKNSNILGYATPDNEIWVFGKIVDGKIVVNEAILGHELMHLLHFSNPTVANPDQLKQIEQLQAATVSMVFK